MRWGITSRDLLYPSYNADFDLPPVVSCSLSTCNKASGLPISLDLIDNDVGIPRGFTREFIEEVEANLARDPDLDKFELETRFSSLDPQKQE